METTVNQRLITICKKYNFNATSFAKKIGISQPTMRSILDGASKPSFDTIEKILNTFSIDAEWLILGIGEMEKTNQSIEIPKNVSTVIKALERMEERIKNLEQDRGLTIAADPTIKYEVKKISE